jgi:hypothetical protein
MKKVIKKIGDKLPAKENKKGWFLLGFGALATGILSYFGFQYWKKNKTESSDTNVPDFKTAPIKKSVTKPVSKPKQKAKLNSPIKPSPTASTAETTQETPVFPLKNGSKGERVKNLQQALIQKHGKGILPKNGANGIFGTELQAALKKLKLPETINETLYHVLVKSTEFDAYKTAMLLNAAAQSKDFTKAMPLLRSIKDSNVYQAVNKFYLNFFTAGVRQTLVNAMLNTFKNENQREVVRLEFVRMGLKYDGKKWSLSGIENKPLLITILPTKVWKNAKESVSVPVNMVLGKELDRRGNFSVFENERDYFLVESKHVKYYTSNS